MNKTCNSISSCAEAKSLLFVKGGYKIFECIKCGHRFSEIKNVETHVERVYSDEYFFEGKDGYPNYLNEKDILYNYGTWYAKIISKYTKPGKVLDIGCAAGFILKGFKEAGWDSYGIEPNETMADYGRKELNLNISTVSLETYENSQQFDLINMIQVIGHFYDLDKAMEKVTGLLNENGLVLVESWHMKSNIARLLGRHWHEYSPPSVVQWFSDKTLAELFHCYGFELVAKGYPAKKINIRHALSLIEEKIFNFIFKKKIFNSLTHILGNFDLNYPPLDLKWYIFRKL